MNFRPLYVAIFGLILPAAQAAEPDKSASWLDAYFQDLRTLQADFRQQSRDGQGQLIEESLGTLAIQRPDRFRWDYRTPHEQVVVADGESVWLYDVDLEQVTVRPLSQSLAGTPASLLSGGQAIGKTFEIESAEIKNRGRVFTLVPRRSDTDFKQVRLRFVQDRLEGMELTDTLGQSTSLEFSNVRRNGKIDVALFSFVPPPGVDVIGAVTASDK